MSLKPLLLISALGLAGCANIGPHSSHVRYPDTPAPTTNRSSGVHIPPATSHTGTGVYTPPPVTVINPPNNEPTENTPPEATDTPNDASYNRPKPASSVNSSPKPQGNAINSLIAVAQNQYRQGNYQGAIATAERGLRIDRRTPELYLILAKSYLQLGQTDQSAQFANQGLRYSTSGSSEAADLDATRHQALGN